MSLFSATASLPRWRSSGLLAATAIVVSLVTWYCWQDEPEQAVSDAAPRHAAGTVFGPGVWTGTDTQSEAAGDDNGLTPPGGLSITENKELIVNGALLDVINFFLLEQAGNDSPEALKRYLKSKLPSPAYDEALQIVAHYQDYMQQHDALLATQNLSSSDLSRIANWRTQRDRLRQRLLGDQVAQVWYQNDDSQLDQALDELQQRRETAQATQPGAAPRRPIPHWSDPAQEQHHIQYMQGLLDKASASYVDQSRAGRQWASRYAAYLSAVDAIDRDGSMNPSERSRRIQELLLKFFPTDAERQHARDRGTTE